MPAAMTPVVSTLRARNLQTGRMEVWQARSTDGAWKYDREDEPGTPWVITHVPTGQQWEETSLPRARAMTVRLDAEMTTRQETTR